MKKSKPAWVLVRERYLKPVRYWRAANTTYVKEFLNTDGTWAVATNIARKFTRDECKRMSPLPCGQFFERSK